MEYCVNLIKVEDMNIKNYENKPQIIVIEDEVDITKAMALCLTRLEAFDVKFFSNAEDAFNCILENIADVELVITDNSLPGMSGMQLISMLQKNPALRHLPVILQSADSKDLLFTYKIQPNCYLQKPWTNQQMIDAIQKALGMIA